MDIDFSDINVQDVFKLYTENLKYKKLLYDQNTELPSVLAVLDKLKKKLETNLVMGIIFIKVESINLIEIKFGWETYDKIIMSLNNLIHEALKNDTPNENIEISLGYTRGDEFNLFIYSKKNGGKVDPHYLDYLANYLQDYLNVNFDKVSEDINQSLSVLVGYSLVMNNTFVRAERLIYQGINEAKQMAGIQQERTEVKRKEKLKGIISNRRIRTLFQPIVQINDFSILGFEALSAGPEKTELESPEILFALADQTGLIIDLDRLCREVILKSAKGLPDNTKLFINVEPLSLDDPQFRKEVFVNMLEELNLDPRNIVLEITERVAIKDFNLFIQSLEQFKSAGFKIAVDDAGAGYSSLNSIAHLKPEFLKFDMTLVRNIDKDHIKQQLLEALLDFADRINSNVIAEGIESEKEFNTLKKLNVQYGQGYYLAKPGPAFPELNVKEKK